MIDNADQLFEQIQSPDHDLRWEAIDRLAKIGDKKVVKKLISLLNVSNKQIRDSVVLTLKEIGDSSAVEPLVKLINDPDNKNNRGTLVHALESLDCSEHFLLMVELALHGNFEVQSHALIILKEQKFKVNKSQILSARKLVDTFLRQDQKFKNYEILLRELNTYINKIGSRK